MKPDHLPTQLWECQADSYCAEYQTWPADDLYWYPRSALLSPPKTRAGAWICSLCKDQEVHYDADSDLRLDKWLKHTRTCHACELPLSSTPDNGPSNGDSPSCEYWRRFDAIGAQQ